MKNVWFNPQHRQITGTYLNKKAKISGPNRSSADFIEVI